MGIWIKGVIFFFSLPESKKKVWLGAKKKKSWVNYSIRVRDIVIYDMDPDP